MPLVHLQPSRGWPVICLPMHGKKISLGVVIEEQERLSGHGVWLQIYLVDVEKHGKPAGYAQ